MELVCTCWTYCQAAIRVRCNSERGASLVEYTLLLFFIAIICIAAITVVGDTTNTRLSSTGSQIQ